MKEAGDQSAALALEGLSKWVEALPAEDAAGECEERGVHVGVALVADA
jgi:hypothetical protein